MAIRSDTNTQGVPTKVDYGMNLAGKQTINGGIVGVEVHLPYSPANGAPLYDVGFGEGKQWTKVSDKIHPGHGPGDLDW